MRSSAVVYFLPPFLALLSSPQQTAFTYTPDAMVSLCNIGQGQGQGQEKHVVQAFWDVLNSTSRKIRKIFAIMKENVMSLSLLPTNRSPGYPASKWSFYSETYLRTCIGFDHMINLAQQMHLQFGLFSTSSSGPQLVHQRLWYVSEQVHIKDPLLFVGKNSICGEAGFL